MVPLLNVTRDPGKTAKFVCHVHNLQPNNTKVNFVWKINEVELEGGNNRTKMKVFKVGNWRYNTTSQSGPVICLILGERQSLEICLDYKKARILR